jgi:uncharacterized protein
MIQTWLFCSLCLLVGCEFRATPSSQLSPTSTSKVETIAVNHPKIQQVIDNAIAQTKVTRSYDPSYVRLAYPGGDVPMTTGVCTDVVIRAWRSIGVDLQQEVHKDMSRNFALYPKLWGLKAPDPNIDHRRVPNLMTWFKRQGKSIAISRNGRDYLPGDIVTWDLGGGQQHIGIVSNIRTPSDRLPIVHNIGAGTKVEDILFNWQIIGHYRYF